MLLQAGFGIDQILATSGQLRFSGGYVELDQRSDLRLLTGVGHECLRGLERAGLRFHVFVISDQAVVGVQHVCHNADDLRFKSKIRRFEVDLGNCDVGRVHRYAEAAQKALLRLH